MRPAVIMLSVFVILSASGCESARESRVGRLVGLSRQKERDAIATALELQERLVEFNNRFSLWVQAAANEIAAESSDPSIQMRTAYWKLFSIPYCREAVYQKEPISALVDVWALCVQMRNYFTIGDGKEIFGDYTPLAVNASGELEDDVETLAATVLPPASFSQAEQTVQTFAREHPMRGPFTRQSARPAMVTASNNKDLAWILDASLSPLRAIGGMDETARAIRDAAVVVDKAATIFSTMPEETRWHSEILLYGIEQRATVKSALDGFTKVADSTENLVSVAEKMPAEVRKQVAALLEDVESSQGTLRATLKETRTALESASQTAVEYDKASRSLAEAAKSIESLFRTFDELFGSDPEAEGVEEPKPSEGEEEGASSIDIYADIAERVAEASTDLHKTLQEIRQVLDSDQVASTVGLTRASAEALIDRVLVVSLAVVAAFFAMLLVYRVAWKRISRPRTRGHGDKVS